MTSNTRATRSRYSSPAQPPNGHGNGGGKANWPVKEDSTQGSRAFMQRWLEPSLQSKPSFEEAGLMRYGVLETMAPLGSLPKAKKSAGEHASTVRKIILRPSGANSAHEATPKAPVEAASTPPPAETLASSPPRRRSLAMVQDAEDDQDYDPKGASRRRQSDRVKKTRRASAGRRNSVRDAEPWTPKQAARRPDDSEPRELRTEKAQSWQPEASAELEPAAEDKGFVDQVMEAAVNEALKHYRYPTAWALRTLYDDKAGDAKFVSMIVDVFNQTADAATLDDFSRQIEEKKREGKKDNRGCYFFIPPSTNSRFTPHKPKPAPYGRLLHLHAHELEQEREQEQEQERERERERELEQMGARAAKKAKTSHHGDSPRKMTARTGDDEPRTPSRKRARRDSASSESSLSSAMSLSSPEGSLGSLACLSPTFRGGATGPESDDAPKSRPITTRGKSLASKQERSNSSESNPHSHSSPNHHHPRIKAKSSAAASTMPGRIAAAQLFPNLATKSTTKPAKTGSKAPLPQDGDAFWDRRRDARSVTNGADVAESSVRGGHEPRASTPATSTRRTRQSLVAPTSTRSTRSASKRSHDDAEGTVSPVALSFHRESSSRAGSRAATPTALRPSKKQRTGLRVKSSPVKKKGGTAAGVPRPTGEVSLSFTNGTAKEPASDNDEYCSACGNAGDVVCCDGCPRSFHFECVDMVPSENLPDEWFCNECLFRRHPSRMPVHRGAFAGALNSLEKSIPRAFSLPKKLQTRFEGVKAGTDGDYEEMTTSKTARKKNGYEEVPDFFRQRDDGQAVLCHDCQKPATDVRAIIPCSLCPFYWHIDCLDPPLAVPPVLKTWRCPLHVDDVLAHVPALAPAHRFRKLKGSQPISPALPRGLKNNGYVEVDWTDEVDDQNESGWRDPASFGRSYKLPAKTIVLDFIEQLRRQGAGRGSRQDETRWTPHTPPPSNPPGASQRTIQEMQASLNLASLNQERPQAMDQLTSALLAAADDNVLGLMARGNAENMALGQLTGNDTLSLRALLAQMDAMSSRIRQVLGEETSPGRAVSRLAQAPTPDALSPEPSVKSDFHDKADVTLPVTEPTPPSTVGQGEGTMELD